MLTGYLGSRKSKINKGNEVAFQKKNITPGPELGNTSRRIPYSSILDKRRYNIVTELIETEKNYIQILNKTIEVAATKASSNPIR